MTNPLPDISTPDDVKQFVDIFYSKVVEDDLLKSILVDVPGVNWDEHCQFCIPSGPACSWERNLINTTEFKAQGGTDTLSVVRLWGIKMLSYSRLAQKHISRCRCRIERTDDKRVHQTPRDPMCCRGEVKLWFPKSKELSCAPAAVPAASAT